MDLFFRLDAFRQLTLPDFLSPLRSLVTARVVRHGELDQVVAKFFLPHEFFAFLVDFRLESGAVVDNDRLLDDQVLLLELSPVLME